MNERGDTLIEVTIALAILAFVLSGCMVVATRAFQLGQTASERSAIADTAQEQVEALREFRDNHSWDEFLGGRSGAGAFGGVLAVGVAPCKFASGCFHMELQTTALGTREYTPVSGPITGSVPGSYLEIEAVPETEANPSYVEFTANYGFESLGGGPDNTNHIQTRLANLKAGIAAGAAGAGGGGALAGALFGSPGTAGTGGHEVIFGKTVINQSPVDPAQVAGCTWDWGDGVVQTDVSCQPGDRIVHNFPPGVTAKYTIVLTERVIGGAQGQYTSTARIPNTISCSPGAGDPACVPD